MKKLHYTTTASFSLQRSSIYGFLPASYFFRTDWLSPDFKRTLHFHGLDISEISFHMYTAESQESRHSFFE